VTIATTTFDVTLQLDEDDDLVITAHTPAGEEFIRGLVPVYTPGDAVVIVATPDDFIAEVPPNLSVGLVNPETNKLHQLTKNRLQ
jgi:hypothetical protein